MCCAGLSLFRNIFGWEFGVNDLRCWCPSNVWLHCKEWCQGQGARADIPPLSLTHGCRHLGAIGAGQVFLLSITSPRKQIYCVTNLTNCWPS